MTVTPPPGDTDDAPQSSATADAAHRRASDRTSSVEQDMRERWKPTDVQMATAARMLRDDSTLRYVMVGLTLPGKSSGWWTEGQPVEAAEGFWPTRTDDDYRAARDAADEAAGRHLAGRKGTSCYATIRLVDDEPHFAVYEGIYGNED